MWAWLAKWWKKINLRKFDISSSCNCVLGQIGEKDGESEYSSYTSTSQRLGILREEDHFGFDTPFAFGDGCDTGCYKYLQKLWTRIIRKRKGLK